MPSKFEIMRRNRPKVARAHTTVVEKIESVEEAMAREWGGERADAELREIAEALARDRERQLPRPSLLRRVLNWSMGMGARA